MFRLGVADFCFAGDHNGRFLQVSRLNQRCEKCRVARAKLPPARDVWSDPEGTPMRAVMSLILLTCCLLTTGCHCCSWTECYADKIDDIADSQPHLDRYYCEQLDLTRYCMNRRCPPRHHH